MSIEVNKQDNTRERIIESAIKLFVKEGCRSVTMDQVAQSIHISKRTLYEIFTDKETLLDTCLQHVNNKIEAYVKKVCAEIKDPMMITIFFSKVLALQTLRYKQLMSDLNDYYPELHKKYYQPRKGHGKYVIMRALQEAQDRHELLDIVNVESLSYVLSMLGEICRVAYPDNFNRQIVFLNLTTYISIRGSLTSEAIERYDNMEELLRKQLELIDENFFSDEPAIGDFMKLNSEIIDKQ